MTAGSGITSHVLDLTTGQPAADLEIVLEAAGASGAWRELGRARTDAGGRVETLTPGGTCLPGRYRLRFETGRYFAARDIAPLHPVVEVAFTVRDGEPHYHVPLLLGPFGYTTYRGS
ncbi:MAG: hydroxyisourate hydrolase [Gemmatimonadota bacterium]